MYIASIYHTFQSTFILLSFFPLYIPKDKWIGLLHRDCNSHEWLNGQCDHEEESHNPNLPWFDKRDNDFTQLQNAQQGVTWKLQVLCKVQVRYINLLSFYSINYVDAWSVVFYCFVKTEHAGHMQITWTVTKESTS